MRGVGAAKKNETHGYSVRDSVFLSFLKLMRPIVNETYFNFRASTTLKIPNIIVEKCATSALFLRRRLFQSPII
jgi:hypothetical protein